MSEEIFTSIDQIKDEFFPKDKIKEDICEICKKNKATINYANSPLDFAHGFVRRICKSCYNKIMKDNEWYKCGVKNTVRAIKEIARQYRNDILKIPVHTLKKNKKGHSKTPEDMRQICAEAFDNFMKEIQVKKIKEKKND
jgi:uncharacterized membrane-anchored protein YjiN (DUF445 family)